MQTATRILRCWERQSDGSEYTRKPFGGRGSAPEPAEGAYSAPANPLVGGKGWLPPPQEPHPRSRSALASPTPTPKLVPTPLVTGSDRPILCGQSSIQFEHLPNNPHKSGAIMQSAILLYHFRLSVRLSVLHVVSKRYRDTSG